MRIGMICYPSYGGSGVLAAELGNALARRGHAVHFIAYDPPVRMADTVEGVIYHEVTLPSYPLFKYPPYLLAMATKLAECAEAEELDLVHVHYAIPHTIAALLGRELLAGRPLPVITTLHGTDVTLVGRDPAFFRLVQYALGKSDAVTAVSESLATDTRRLFGHSGPIRVIPNFTDPGRFHPQALCRCRAALGPPGDRLLIHVSNFRPVKNTPDVVRLFARVAGCLPAQLLMVGDGPEQPRCRELARELGLLGRVHFLAETPRVEGILACAHLFLLPSSSESFGLAALEAMACGLPVLAYRVGGVPEVVEHGATGLLFEPGDLEGMARGAVELLQDEERRGALGAAGRGRVLDQFTSERVVPLYERCYEESLERTRGC